MWAMLIYCSTRLEAEFSSSAGDERKDTKCLEQNDTTTDKKTAKYLEHGVITEAICGLNIEIYYFYRLKFQNIKPFYLFFVFKGSKTKLCPRIPKHVNNIRDVAFYQFKCLDIFFFYINQNVTCSVSKKCVCTSLFNVPHVSLNQEFDILGDVAFLQRILRKVDTTSVSVHLIWSCSQLV